MNLSELSVRRPVAVAMVIIGILVFGGVALSKLAVDLYPELNLPIAAVITSYPGAGPEEIENQLTRPIEEALGTVNGVDTISSTTTAGSSMVLVWYNWGTDMDVAAQQMREKVDRIKSFLPSDIDEPMILKVDPASMPIVQIGVAADRDITEVKQIAEDKIKNRLERLEGVASVSVTGGLVREVQVLTDPNQLNHYGITIAQLAGALRGENQNISNGELEDGTKLLYLRTLGQFKSLKEIENISINTPGGATIQVKDVARIVDGNQEVKQVTRMDGVNSVGIHVLKQTDANIVKVAESVQAELKALEKELPKDFQIKVMVDQSEFISQSIDQVINNTVSGGVLSIIVLFLFLRNFRSTLVISLSIPISIIATFTLIYFNGMTLNMMSLGGLALGVGMMVDNSIVILENIFRYRQNGHSLFDAAVKGSQEVGTAVIASTLTTVAVFLPIVFVEGIAGQFFKQLALTVTFSLMCSLLAAMTLVPMMASKMLTKIDAKPKFAIFRKVVDAFGGFFDRLDNFYRRALQWAMHHRWKTVGIVVLAMASIAVGMRFVGAEFMPKLDTSELAVSIELPKGSLLAQTTNITDEVEAIVNKIPEKKAIFTSIGSSGQGMGLGGAQVETAQVRISLVKVNQRTRSTDQIVDNIREQVGRIPGAKFTVNMIDTSQGGPGGGLPVAIKIKGDDLEILTQLSNEIMGIVKDVKGTREVETSLEEGQPELQIKVNRERAGQLGLSAAQIADTIRSAVGGQVATQYRVGGEEYDVRVMLEESSRASLNDVANLTINSAGGAIVPVKDLVTFENGYAPNSINREDQVRVANVNADIVGRDVASVNKDIQAKLDTLQLPVGYSVEMGGAQKDMQDSFADLGLALVLAIILVYMVMAAQFESLLYPFIIMFSLPTTAVGVVWGLAVTGRDLSVPAFIGVIMLAGIVVNNGIVLVDYINVLRRRGMARLDAIIEAGPTRLRPILMTTLTTVLGMLPLAMGIGEGSESQAPMATAVVFGLSSSTLFTLIFVPVVYSLLDDFSNWLKRKFGFDKSESAEQPETVIAG